MEENLEFKKEVSQIRPWARYFARSIDLILFSFIIGFILLFYGPSTNIDVRSLSFAMLIIWNFIEAQLLSSVGYTPGKKLLHIQVVDQNGNKLTFGVALKRGFLVWLAGLGMGIVSIITMIIAYSNLRKEKVSFWDRHCQSHVVHTKIRAFEIIIVILIYSAFIALYGFF